MIQSKSTFFIALFIFLTETFFGLPSSWKAGLIIVLALALMVMSLKISLPKRQIKRPRRKEKVTQVFVENAPIQTQDIEV